MILQSVEARHVLKYRSLSLTDLPAQGLIAVAGSNEAGKTAIGETICLGLFGRTFSLPAGEIRRVVRWGEFSGTVSVTFKAGDEVYTIEREVESTGEHRARLTRVAGGEVLAEGVEAVGAAMRDTVGFTYRSFVDSFYLAQREMEVPAAKSDTVKALIGVDRLEAVARALEEENKETGQVVSQLEADIEKEHRKIAALNIDRARLGRLEVERTAKAHEAEVSRARGEKMRSRAASLAKAAETLRRASAMFVKSTTRVNCTQWRQRRDVVATSLSAAREAAKVSGVDAPGAALAQTGTALASFDRGLAEYDKIRNLSELYRSRLTFLLEDSPAKPTGRADTHASAERNIEACFAHRRRTAQDVVEKTMAHRKIMLVVAIVAVEVAMLGWVAWAAPSTTLGRMLHAAVPLGAAGQSVVVLLGAIFSTLLTVAAVAAYLMFRARLMQLQEDLTAIDIEERTSRVEVEVMATVDAAPIPEALSALGHVRNDLLHSAVVSFAAGDGAVLVRPDALAAKLEEIRFGSGKATQALVHAHEKLVARADDTQREADKLNEAVAALDEKIAAEQALWKQLEALERTVAGLGARLHDARHSIVVRTLGRELIEGACRQVYERFYPELRRFVGRILPRLTEDRYEHLEIDDDLQVRVFCKDKNDFVGLAEVSNGTHRQLMLCVRLALSQALIASSSNAAQFIFLDEPFVFFDEQRVAAAINVLKRISPELTQVFLAAQRFDQPEAFDLSIECDVDRDEMELSGKRRRRVRVAG